MRVLLLVVLALTLSGCATPYQKNGLTGGYSDVQLGENIFQVSFRGNGKTSFERANDFILLRSAEVAIENGFEYFVIADSLRSSKDYTRTTPTRSRTTGSVYDTGSYSHVSATTRTSGGRTYTVSKPRLTNKIVCYKDKPEVEGLVFKATFVKDSLRQKYNLKP